MMMMMMALTGKKKKNKKRDVNSRTKAGHGTDMDVFIDDVSTWHNTTVLMSSWHVTNMALYSEKAILCVFVSYCIAVVLLWARWGGPDGIEA